MWRLSPKLLECVRQCSRYLNTNSLELLMISREGSFLQIGLLGSELTKGGWVGATVPENARPQGLAPSETSAAERAGFPKPARPARVEIARRSGGSDGRPTRAYFRKTLLHAPAVPVKQSMKPPRRNEHRRARCISSATQSQIQGELGARHTRDAVKPPS